MYEAGSVSPPWEDLEASSLEHWRYGPSLQGVSSAGVPSCVVFQPMIRLGNVRKHMGTVAVPQLPL